jgi:hypothetical protein
VPARQPVRRVAVVDEEEIFRLGVVAWLDQDPKFEIVFSGPAGPLTEEADVAVASAQAVARYPFECPVVVCSNDPPASIPATRTVVAVLPRATLTGEQLVAAVSAAAAGLRVSSRGSLPEGPTA